MYVKNNIRNRKVQDIIAYLNENYMIAESQEKIAEHCTISKSYMCKLFKKEMGISVLEYITNLRITYACQLIKKTDLSITEIAIVCGFNSSQYFSSVFKHIKGKTPTEYRKEHCLDVLT